MKILQLSLGLEPTGLVTAAWSPSLDPNDEEGN
jgi:hypothetical protein